MAIKKAFQDVVALLEENPNKKVKDILPEILTMCSAKSGGGAGGATVRKDKDGNVTHIFCYYHKMWEPVNKDGSGDDKHCAYGAKATSATGLSSMCKEGTSAWTKQQAASKKASPKLLADVAAGDVKPDQLTKLMAKIEKARTAVVPRKDGIGEAPAKAE